MRAALSLTTDMRPGSLVERFRVCGKPTCRRVQAIPSDHERARGGQRAALRWATATRGGLAGDGEKGGFKEIFEIKIRSEIDTLVGTPVDQWDLEAIEVAARREALRIAGLAVARRLKAGHRLERYDFIDL